MANKEDLVSWIEQSFKKGMTEVGLRDELLKAGYSKEKIDLIFLEYNKMGVKKSKVPVVIGIILILVLVIGLFVVNFYMGGKESDSPVGIDNSDRWAFPALETDPERVINISGDQYVNSILSSTIREVWLERPNCMAEENALIYLVHIKRQGGDYEFNCSFGRYQTFQPYKTMGKNNVYYASIEGCNAEVIRNIDESILMGGDCRFPLSFPEKLEGLEFDEYYAFHMGCERITLDESYIKFLRTRLPCFYFLSDEQAASLVGEEMNILGFGGIIIPSLNMVIY